VISHSNTLIFTCIGAAGLQTSLESRCKERSSTLGGVSRLEKITGDKDTAQVGAASQSEALKLDGVERVSDGLEAGA
jgi:hypothetical protein